MAWNPFFIALVGVYCAALILTGVRSARHKGDSNQYLNATSSLPAWVCATACVAANCGSIEIFAMTALGAQYGMLACHFYWIGAIPGLLAVAFWLLPAYKRSRNPTILDFIGRHYGKPTRSIVALSMAAMMLLIAGVSLCAVAQMGTALLGWTFLRGVLLSASVVLFYTWVGGFRATVYTELLHFALVLAAVVPLPFLAARQLGGFRKLMAGIPASRFHAWRQLPLFNPHATMDVFGLVLGLGLVLGFGFWGTDFVQMQRALAVRRDRDAPLVPLSVGFAKLAFSLLIITTGVAAPLVLSSSRLSANWNGTLPALMMHFYPPFWLVLGFMGLAASVASTFSNNVAGFTSAWVQGIYQPWLRPDASEQHYTRVSRATNAVVVLLAVGTAYFALGFQSMMEYIQWVLAIFNAPIFALVALAALAPRRAAAGGRTGLLCGLACAVAHQVLVLIHVLRYGSQMTANFYGAIFGFAATLACTLWLGSRSQAGGSLPQSRQLSVRPRTSLAISWPALAAGIVLAGLFLVFTAIFR
ncbi:MAG: sodium:solute symporter family transporter [Terracidiphilus sp.]